MSRSFQRRVEDFTCEVCGLSVRGTGYTNHCPRCLWSKHVDVQPGDRAATCHGLMEPIALEIRGDRYILLHRCTRCGVVRRNKAAADDDFAALLRVARGLPTWPRPAHDLPAP